MSDDFLETLAGLPHAEPDCRRSAQVRSLCHEVLARHRQRSAGPRVSRRWWEPLVVGLGGLYLAGVVREALLVYGVL